MAGPSCRATRLLLRLRQHGVGNHEADFGALARRPAGLHEIDKITVRNIWRRHHMAPAPQRRQGGMSWPPFLKMHWEVLAATDFCTVEVVAWHGLPMECAP